MELKVGEVLFLDTNVLLTATDASRPQHRAARDFFAKHRAAGIHLAVSGQILREYLVVATRPARANGLGLRPKDALSNSESTLRSPALFKSVPLA